MFITGFDGLPLRMRFPKSKLYESIFTPIIIGLMVGFIAAIMGIGGAFILVPAMIYIIKMPTKLVPGTIFVCNNFCKCNCNLSSCI